MSGPEEEEKQRERLTGLKAQAIDEYEDLRAANNKKKEECDKIKQERDEAVKKLEEFQKISHMVIEEVNCMQNHLEIEKTCRESAEALASKVNKVKEEKVVLTAEVHEQRKLLEKCNRVSVLAVEEYEELQENFELEKNLRKKAESFAQEMYIEQNKLKRQSHLLLQNSAPDQQLLKALDENAKLTQTLEEERHQHQQKVKELEEKLENEALHKEISCLQQQLGLLEEDKKELELKWQNSEEKVKNLKHSVDELQKRIHRSENPAPPPLPPPPPPLPPPNPIRSLMSMIRKKSHPSSSVSKKERAPQQESGEEVGDLKRQAVEEMMDRIKKGVHLRPVNQSSRPKTKPEAPKASDSAVKELKGILETLNKSTSSRSLKSLETDTENNETELERILRRRKVTAEQDSSSLAGVLATSESKSMPVLGSESGTTQTALNKKTLEAELSSKTPELGEGSLQMKGSTSSKVTFRSPSYLGFARKSISSENQMESIVVLDPVSASQAQTKDQMLEKIINQHKMKEEKNKQLYKETTVDKAKDSDSSNC
ncbi:shootin-1 isoform X2 [Dermochelys coriacea]|uniref:shootin-1 isoform X2 n=1 Tax=Dermochelys coriacea TaxID=27794 RepID=UPI001CA8EFAD|nr:shootin-1 isoform X2 [Dermochelys coriacea]